MSVATAAAPALGLAQIQIGDKIALNSIFADALGQQKPARFKLGTRSVVATNNIEPTRTDVHGYELADMEVVCFSGEPMTRRLGIEEIIDFEPILGHFRGGGVWTTRSAVDVTLPAGICNRTSAGITAHLVGFALAKTTGTVTTLVAVAGKHNTRSERPLLAVVPFEADKLALA